MKSGIYALASLDGAPIDRADRGILSLADGACAIADGSCFVRARDHRAAAIHVTSHDDGIDALLGDLDEVSDLIRALGLPGDSAPLAVVCAAHERYGADAAQHVLGEWLLVRWNRHSRTLTLLMAECVRDSCFVATDGKRVAIAPDLAMLARLSWVDSAFDPATMLLTLGRAPLRRAQGERTILRDVRRLLPNTCMTIRADRCTSVVAEPWPLPALVSCSFDEAIVELDATLRRIMAQQMARYDKIAFMLSGGLDSTLLALFGTLERRPGQQLIGLTSAAPPGSGLDDETARARATADRLGFDIIDVAPAASANVYLPTARTFSCSPQPVVSNTHHVSEAFFDVATAWGAAAMVDGTGGEFTVSNYGDVLGVGPPTSRLRRLINAVAGKRRSSAPEPLDSPDNLFHVRLARHRRDTVSSEIADLATDRALPVRRRARDEAFGIEPGAAKSALQTTAGLDPAVRCVLPFVDRRLLRQFAAFPAGFVAHRGMWRAPARALLKDRVPAPVYKQPQGKPFSPGYAIMMREHAAAALARLPAQRAAGAGEWLDMDWLEQALRNAARAAPATQDEQLELQLTAVAAEFFCWWQGLKS